MHRFWTEPVVRITGRTDTLHDNLRIDAARAALVRGGVRYPASQVEVDIIHVDRAADLGMGGPNCLRPVKYAGRCAFMIRFGTFSSRLLLNEHSFSSSIAEFNVA
jgi:hypothetical protein